MEAILTGVNTLTALVGDVFTMITGNALLAVFAAAGLLSVGLKLFKRGKSAAK